jgi:hypothetical protein
VEGEEVYEEENGRGVQSDHAEFYNYHQGELTYVIPDLKVLSISRQKK